MQCCAELAACNDVSGCIDCLFNGGDCSDPAIQEPGQALLDCQSAACAAECTPPCNPVNNEPCSDTPGAACDFNSSSPNGFTCYPDGNTAKICEACGDNGIFCEGGMTCGADGKCAKFCCDDGDCSAGMTCDKAATGSDLVGICADANGASDCMAPLTSPSGGSCVTL